jgi:hypothetical protein
MRVSNWGRGWLESALLLLLCATPMHAALTVLVGEPFGSFGTMMPLGHTAIYLDRVCADGPLHVRMCEPGERPGVVLARYHAIGKYDWLAVPVMDFLYAADRMEDVPQYATPQVVWAMRERYRQRFLRSVVPDGTQGEEFGDGRSMGAGSLEEWWESAGMAYNRRIWAYQVATTEAQDERLVEVMNADENRHLYHLRRTNCADFAAQIVNLYFPGAVHHDKIAEFGLMTPKQVARSLTAYAASRPELGLKVWEIPQVPGSLRRSRPVRGGAEAGLKTKRYLLPLIAIQPEVPAGLTVLYLWHGRWKLGAGAEPMPEFADTAIGHTELAGDAARGDGQAGSSASADRGGLVGSQSAKLP